MANSRMPVRRRSRRRKLTPVTVLVVVALVAGIALLARITQSRSASEPASSSACGNWQQKYAKLHREVLAGRRPRRLCIATTRDEQGLYDRLTGFAPTPNLSSAWLLALLRCLSWPVSLVPSEAHVDTPRSTSLRLRTVTTYSAHSQAT